MNTFTSIIVLVSFCLVACGNAGYKAQSNAAGKTAVSTKKLSKKELKDLSKATFAGGCFWCTEAQFERIKGVVDVISGYSGGKIANPTYKQVSAGRTTHAEAIEIYYDPKQISYAELLEIFFAGHDPTQLNRQGPDVGKQYRSAVFYRTEEEKALTENYIKQLNESGKYDRPIVTEVTAFTNFYEAEDYHQDFYRLNPNQGYVRAVSRPKVEKIEKLFKDKLKAEYK